MFTEYQIGVLKSEAYNTESIKNPFVAKDVAFFMNLEDERVAGGEEYIGDSLCCNSPMIDGVQCLNCGADGNELVIPAHMNGDQMVDEQIIRRKTRDEYDDNLE